MDKRVYFLMTVSFIVGMVELVIGGILDLIAADLNISLGLAGLLITSFSLTFGIAAPILLVLTAKVERKKLMLISLAIFFIGNLLVVVSPSFIFIFVGRIISAATGSILTILCITMAANLVEVKYRGRAIGLVNMGVSASLVLGVPIGLNLGHHFGWRAPFVLVCILTIISMIGVFFLMGRVAPRPVNSIKEQLSSLKNKKVLTAHLTIFILLTGHTALYAYLTPFVTTTMGLDANGVSLVYLIFGIAAVSGGALGGTFADKFGPERIMVIFIIIYITMIFSISFVTQIIPLFIIVLVIWGMMSWSVTPPMQTYLMKSAPETSDIQISLNNSALHFGVAFGSFIGAIIIDTTSVEVNPFVGGSIALLALIFVTISLKQKPSESAH